MFSIFEAIETNRVRFYVISFSNLNLLASSLTAFVGAVVTTEFNLEMITNLTEMSKILKFYWFLWTQCLIFAMISSLNYWTILHHGSLSTVDVIKVIVLPILLLIDLCVVKHPARFYNFVHMLIVNILVIIFTVIFQFAGGSNE